MVAGRLCHGKADARVIRAGLWGILVFLILLSISVPLDHSAEGTPTAYRHLLGFWGSLPALAMLGVAAGFFAIPLQVFIQSRPPEEHKGRMIAIMNQANFLAIMMSGFTYGRFDQIVESLQWPRSPIFAMMAALILPVLVLYRPKFD